MTALKVRLTTSGDNRNVNPLWQLIAYFTKPITKTEQVSPAPAARAVRDSGCSLDRSSYHEMNGARPVY